MKSYPLFLFILLVFVAISCKSTKHQLSSTDSDWKNWLAIESDEGLQGYYNPVKEEFSITPQFEYATNFYANGWTPIQVDGKWFAIDSLGNIPSYYFDFDQVERTRDDALIPARNKDKWGFINRNGEIVIPLAYDEVKEFMGESLTPIKTGGKYGYINEKGEMIIPPEFSDAKRFYKHKNLKVAAVKKDSKYGLIDTLGHFVMKPKFDDIEVFHSENGLFQVRNENMRGCIDMKGVTKIPLEYEYLFPFSEESFSVKKDGYWTIIDKNGKKIIPEKFEYVYYYNQEVDLAGIKKNGKYGFINRKGEEVIPPQYDDVGGFSQGLSPVKKYGRWGFINIENEMVIEPIYEDGYTGFSSVSHLAPVKLDGQWGFINKAGEMVIPPEIYGINVSTMAQDFAHEQLGWVRATISLEKRFYVNKNHKIITDNSIRETLLKKGDAKSLYDLGLFYAFSYEGVEYIKQSAEEGYVNAQLLLAAAYTKNINTPIDNNITHNPVKALEWAKKAKNRKIVNHDLVVDKIPPVNELLNWIEKEQNDMEYYKK